MEHLRALTFRKLNHTLSQNRSFASRLIISYLPATLGSKRYQSRQLEVHVHAVLPALIPLWCCQNDITVVNIAFNLQV